LTVMKLSGFRMLMFLASQLAMSALLCNPAPNVRFGWKAAKGLELSLVGQTLLDNRHTENTSSVFVNPVNEIRRSVTGKVTWTF